MRDPASNLIRKLWHYCNVLRDDGLSYPDYVEQLTYLLFLKMSSEQSGGPVPRKYSWQLLSTLDARAMHSQYTRTLSAMSKRSGMLGLIFRNARNKIRDPAKLRLLVVELIGQTEWTGLSADIKGDAYEGLLEKNARDTKSGAGQYFTPRPLIEAIVECVDPRPGEVICDPACGTAGFLLAAYDHVRASNPAMSPVERKHLATRALRGFELVEEVARLATMNLLLHGLNGESEGELPIVCADSLKNPPSQRVSVVLTNPPFGVKGSITYAAGNGRKNQRRSDDLTVIRPDFWVQTSNKQLNFLQHVFTLLTPRGRAAIVVPDNVLFEGGVAAIIRRRLLDTCNVHTLLRLPTGIFYAQGVKANVLFFDRTPPKKLDTTKRILIYDLRSADRFSLKTRPLKRENLREFVELYRSFDRESALDFQGSGFGRWNSFDVKKILESELCPLDLDWPNDSSTVPPASRARLDEISRLIAADLQKALSFLQSTLPDKP